MKATTFQSMTISLVGAVGLLGTGCSTASNFHLRKYAACSITQDVIPRFHQVVGFSPKAAAFCCLIAYAVSLLGFWPSALVLAALDGSHSATISSEGSRLALILHHPLQESTSTDGPDHQHGFAADLLVSTVHDSPSHDDHVILIASPSEHLAESAPLLPCPSSPLITVPEAPVQLVHVAPGCDRIRLRLRPPPDPSAFLHQVCSVVLLV